MLLHVKERYDQNLDTLKTELAVGNVHALPKITKVNVTVGLGMHRTNKEMVSYITQSLEIITGQKPVETFARKAIAGFKLRQGDLVGLRVTLRGRLMNDFLNRLINITLPRIRDFRGITVEQFDKQGNLTLGFKDQIPFAELNQSGLEKSFGLGITVSINYSSPDKSLKLLKTLGFPMKNQ